MAFKLVISDPKTRKSYQKEVTGEGILGKKIGDKFSGAVAGLDGYELQITGGTDKDGFPMRKDVDGSGRKKILLSGGVGFKPQMEGQRKRKSIRGGTVSEDLAQINSKVIKQGKSPLDKVFSGEKKEELKAEEKPKEEVKEEAPAEEKPAEEPESAPEEKSAEEGSEEKKEDEAPSGEEKKE